MYNQRQRAHYCTASECAASVKHSTSALMSARPVDTHCLVHAAEVSAASQLRMRSHCNKGSATTRISPPSFAGGRTPPQAAAAGHSTKSENVADYATCSCNTDARVGNVCGQWMNAERLAVGSIACAR